MEASVGMNVGDMVWEAAYRIHPGHCRDEWWAYGRRP